MLKYIFSKVSIMLVTLFIVVTLIFFIMKWLPGGPLNRDVKLPDNVIQLLEKKYKLDKPIMEQYTEYLKNMVKFDFGYSYRRQGQKVINIIGGSLKYSLIVGGISFFSSFIIGILLTIISEMTNNRIIDKIIKSLSTLGIAIPNFVLAVICLYIFGEKMQLVPVGDIDDWKSYILPVVVLSVYPISVIIKIFSISVKKSLSQTYISVLKRYGVCKRKIFFKYILKDSLFSVITYMAPAVSSIFIGSFAIEKIFGIPGIGRVFIESIFARDYPVVFALTLLYTVIYLVAIFLSDICYAIVNPRISINNK